MPDSAYRGRFAPSPTGPLHFGSLVAAVGSWADTRAQGGEWLVRMEDLDPPRESPGAAADILRTLERLGLEWDGPVMRQSERGDAYRAAVAQLASRGVLFACACTRKEIADSQLDAPAPGAREPVYPGTCRDGLPPGRAPRATRVRVGDALIGFDDALQGRLEQRLAREVGDFVLVRADGPFAYQLAVVVDDAAQGVTDVVRGADLLGSTPRQIFLQRLLGAPTPRYLHLPVAVTASGEKLSKQTGAPPVDTAQPARTLVAALEFLGQTPPAGLAAASARTVLEWAAAGWNRAHIPRARVLPAPG